MKSLREVTTRYNKIVAHKEIKGDVKPGRVNTYTCECGNKVKTIDVANGTTPFMIKCSVCNEMMKSSFYKDIYPELKPTLEWYRPSLDECLKMRKKEGELEHILMGGLIYRTIKTK